MVDQPAQVVTTVTNADVANAKNLNAALSAVRRALDEGSSGLLTALASIATAITASIIGGTTGGTANRALVSKGTTGLALQPTVVSIDPATGDINTNGGDLAVDDIAAQDGVFSTTLTLGGIGVATLNTNTWLQQQGFARQSLTDAATITWNAQTQQSAYVLLTAAVGATRTLGAPSNLVSGFTYILMVQQSSTGSNALTYNAVYKWPSGTAPVLSTANNAIDILTFVTDGTNMYGVAQKTFS